MLKLLGIFAALVLIAANAAAAPAAAPQVDGNELLTLGFKVLVAKTRTQEDWVKQMAPGKIRAVQRTGKKYFIYPDAANKQIYVGGPKEYQAYRDLHPDTQLAGQGSAQAASAYRAKQDKAMKEATARDLSDPFYGVDWVDLGW
jgi:Ni/Co efflux regulator RcnB